MRDTFLTKNTKAQVHKDVRPITSDCEVFPIEDLLVEGPSFVESLDLDECKMTGEMRKTYSPSGPGGMAPHRPFGPSEPGTSGMAKAGTFKPTKP